MYRYAKLEKQEADLTFMELWIKKNSESKNHTDRPLKWTQLLDKLQNFKIGYELDTSGQKIILKKTIYKGSGILFLKQKEVVTKIYPYKSDVCSKILVKDIRRDFGLTKVEGFDGLSFYNENTFIDAEILLFKKAIYRLSKN